MTSSSPVEKFDDQRFVGSGKLIQSYPAGLNPDGIAKMREADHPPM